MDIFENSHFQHFTQRNIRNFTILLWCAHGNKWTFLKTVIFQYFTQQNIRNFTILLWCAHGNKWTFFKSTIFKNYAAKNKLETQKYMQSTW
jgi:hypothetical protein